MLTPYQHTTQKYMYDFLKDKYMPNRDIIERASNIIMTQQDLNNWVNMVGAIYALGYLKAAEQYNDELKKLGYDVHLVPSDHT